MADYKADGEFFCYSILLKRCDCFSVCWVIDILDSSCTNSMCLVFLGLVAVVPMNSRIGNPNAHP